MTKSTREDGIGQPVIRKEDAALVTGHRVALSGLKDATTYHYRARSRDAAGNLAMSPDFTFKTRDATAPSVPSVRSCR